MNRTVTVAGALIVLFVLLVPAIGPPASAPAARAPDAAGPVATGVRSSSPPLLPLGPSFLRGAVEPGQVGPVSRSLVVYNDTVVPGNDNQTGPVGPQALALDPGSGMVYAAMTPVSQVEAVSPSTGQGLWARTVPSGALALAFDPMNGDVDVAGGSSGNITLLDPSTRSLVGTFALGGDVGAMTYDPGLHALLVTDPQLDLLEEVNASTGALVHRVVVGAGASSATVDPRSGDILVTDGSSTNASVVRASTFQVVANVSVGLTPVGAVMDATVGEMFVVNSGSANVSVVNTTTWRTVASVPVGSFPSAAALDPDTGTVLVADAGSGNVSWIDPSTDRSSAGPPGFYNPQAVLEDPVSDELLVANQRTTNLTVLSAATQAIAGEIPLGSYPEDVVFDPVNGLLYAVVLRPGDVVVIDPYSLKVVTWIPVGDGPTGLGIDPVHDRIYVANTGYSSTSFAGSVSVIDGSTNSVVATLRTPNQPSDVVYDPVTTDIYVADGGGPPSFPGAISVINGTTGRLVTNFTAGVCQEPDGITFDPSNRYLVVGCLGANGLDVLNASTGLVVRFVDLGGHTSNERFDPVNGHLYATVVGGGGGNPAVAVLNGFTLHQTGNISVGILLPVDLDVDTNDGTVAVAMENAGKVWLISPNDTLLASLPVGAEPDAVGFDTVDGAFYVAGGTSGTESEVPVLLTASFRATPPVFTLGNSTALGLSVLDGASVLHYAYAGLPPGCASANLSLLPCLPTAAGSYTVLGYANDTYGKSVVAAVGVTVHPVPQVTAFTAQPDPTAVGALTRLQATVANGTPPYTYAYLGLPPGCSTWSAASLNCTPSSPGTFQLEVLATDADRRTADGWTNLTVQAGLVVASLRTSPSIGVEGRPLQVQVTVAGGNGGNAYAYTGLPPGCLSANVPTLPCTPAAAGSFTVTVHVTDSAGDQASSSTGLWVVPPLGVASFAASPDPVGTGGLTTFLVGPTGGAGGSALAFRGLPAGCTSSNLTSLPCTPTVAGTFAVEVVVTDGIGETATAWTNLTVTPGSAASSAWLLPTLLGVVALAAVVAVVLFHRRRRRDRAPPPVALPGAGPAPEGGGYAPYPPPYPSGPAPYGETADAGAFAPGYGP